MSAIPASQFWLYRWLDEHRVRDLADASRLLGDESGLSRLKDYAQRHHVPAEKASDFSIVAGRGADLSGILDCNAPECRIRQVDRLLRHSWHYFDEAVVEDAVSHEVTHHWTAPAELRRNWILGHIRVLLHLQSIGAADLVRFFEKPIPCEDHWQRHASEAGLDEAVVLADRFVDELVTEARITLSSPESGKIGFAMIHPSFEHTVWGHLPIEAATDIPLAHHLAAKGVYRRYLANLTSDVGAARSLHLPIGSAIWFHGRILRGIERGPLPEEVAFHLDLPILQNVPIPKLVEIRRDETDAFLRFRLALRKAARERARALKQAHPGEIAREIQHDLIEPELHRIGQRLKTAEQMLAKKAAVGITLGALATTCGLIAGIDPGVATTAGVAAMSTVVGATAAKDIEERREATLSDMYFLWKAVDHAH